MRSSDKIHGSIERYAEIEALTSFRSLAPRQA